MILVDAAVPVFLTVGAVVRLRIRFAGFQRVPVVTRVFPRRLRRFRGERERRAESDHGENDDRRRPRERSNHPSSLRSSPLVDDDCRGEPRTARTTSGNVSIGSNHSAGAAYP